MNKFKVGDKVQRIGGSLGPRTLTVRGIYGGRVWCGDEAGGCFGTYLEGDLEPITPSPAEVLAKLERLVRLGDALIQERDGIVRVNGDSWWDTLAEAIMAAPESEVES